MIAISVDRSSAITAVLTRGCRGIECPGAGDDLTQTTCLANTCVDPRCNEGDTEFCPDPQCASSSDCHPSDCARATCEQGVCLYSLDDSVCGAGEACDEITGCTCTDPRGCDPDGPPVLGPPPSGTISAGFLHTCALSGTNVYCWGYNGEGQVIPGGAEFVPSPTSVVGLANDVIAVTAGGHHSCALTQSGLVYCWGLNGDGQLGRGTSGAPPAEMVPVVGLSDVVQVSAGWLYTCAVVRAGQVHCWGDNSFAQLGIGAQTELEATPRLVANTNDAVFVSTGQSHTCVTHADGRASCWGENHAGAVGDGVADIVCDATGEVCDWELVLEPTNVVDVEDFRVVQVSSQSASCGLREGGELVCWGRDAPNPDQSAHPSLRASGQKGNIALGDRSGCSIGAAGTLTCWGVGDVTGHFNSASLADVLEVTAGGEHLCARTSDESVYCWGRSDSGQLGTGTVGAWMQYIAAPQLVVLP